MSALTCSLGPSGAQHSTRDGIDSQPMALTMQLMRSRERPKGRRQGQSCAEESLEWGRLQPGSFVGGSPSWNMGGGTALQRRSQATAAGASRESETEPELIAMELERLERELAAAVSSEDYATAASLRDKLRRLQEDEEAAVIAANSLFYRAFAGADMRRMRQLWAKGDHVQCIHPGANCIQGYEMVMESWDLVLSGERRLMIDVEGIRCYIRGSMAFVTCVEVLRSDGASGRVIATNIFEKRNGQWLMILHQGAAAPPGAMFA